MLRQIRQRSKIHVTLIACFSLIVACSAGFTTYSYIDNYQIAKKNEQAEIARIAKQKTIAAAIEAKKKEPVYIALPNSKKIRAIVEDYSKPNSLWAIVNKTHPISVDYVPSPIKIPNITTRTDKSDDERSVRSDIAAPLQNMFAQAAADGHPLMIGSAYRSASLQKIYFDNLSASIGEEAANQSIARSGQSEHQTGLAIDISTLSQQCYLDKCFATTDDGLWLSNNSYKFGFILRYPEGKESITGYQYEPWHFRYVGVNLATALYESNLTLDEAWPYLESALATLKSNGAL